MKDEGSYQMAVQLFTDYLAKNNCRKTMERFAILEQVFSFKGHFTAETLHEKIGEINRISLATVYNTLDLLVSCGLVLKHTFPGQSVQYEKICETAHHHLVCTNCGRVTEFTDKNIKSAIMAKAFANFKVASYSLYVYGKCKRCRKKR